jgi:hypothetical protein
MNLLITTRHWGYSNEQFSSLTPGPWFGQWVLEDVVFGDEGGSRGDGRLGIYSREWVPCFLRLRGSAEGNRTHSEEGSQRTRRVRLSDHVRTVVRQPFKRYRCVCLLSSPQLGFFLHLLLRNPRLGRETHSPPCL